MNSVVNFSWLYRGVNHSLAGNGGPECVNFLSSWRRGVETFAVCALSVAYMIYGFRRLYVPKCLTKTVEPRDRFGKRLLLVLMCLTFGCEVGFKLSSKTLIYALNPCHVVTLLQIYLLASPPRRHVTIVFRFHFHCLNGAILALVFPVLNTRLLPFEKEVYFIQHIMILVIPFYLLRVGGVYTIERFGDFSWTLFVLGALLLYHFIILQMLGLVTQVNLNNMLCPAVSDPFHGPNYRVWAIIHQSLFIVILGKAYMFLASVLLVTIGHQGVIHHPEEISGKIYSGNNCTREENKNIGFWSRIMRLLEIPQKTVVANNINSKVSNGHVE